MSNWDNNQWVNYMKTEYTYNLNVNVLTDRTLGYEKNIISIFSHIFPLQQKYYSWIIINGPVAILHNCITQVTYSISSTGRLMK